MTKSYSEKKWNGRRTKCPQCGARRGLAVNNEHSEYCHAGCGYILPKNTPENKDKEIQKKTINQKYIEEHHVKQSYSLLENIIPSPNHECTSEEERAAIMEYDGGLSKEEAEFRSGYARQRLIEELTELRLQHPFAEILVRLTRPSIFQEWNIGLLKDNTVIFWYQDCKGRFVNGKRVKFKEDGFHKDMANFLYTKDQGFFQCLYGEHQLHPSFTNYRNEKYNSNTRVVLVESEKTAIIMSHHKPEFLWIATGGMSGLTKEKARILSGRTALVLFDCDDAGEKGATKTCDILSSVGAKPEKLDQWKLVENPPEGYDIADLIYNQFRTKEATA